MAVSDRDNQIADLKKKLETSTYYYSQNKNAFLDSRTHNDELTDENEKLKEQLSATTSTYYDNAKLRQEKEVVATELKNTQIVFEVVVKNLESQLQAAKEAAIEQDDALRDKEKEVEELLTGLATATYYKELYKDALTRKDTKIAELKEQLQSAEDLTVIGLKEQLQTIITERNKRDTEYETLSEQYDKLHKANESLTAEIVKLKTVTTEWDNMYKGYVTTTNENNKLKAENTSLTTKVATLQLEKSVNYEKASTEKDVLSNDLAAEIYERGLCETAIENYKATIAKQDDQLQIVNNEIISLKEKVRATTNENSKLELENAKYKTVNSVTLVEVMDKNTQLEHRISQFIDANSGLREEVIKTKLCNSRLEHEKTSISVENTRLKEENKSLAKNLANLRLAEVANKELNTKHSTLKNSYDSLQAETTQLKTELQTTKLDLAKNDKVISDAEIKYSHDQAQAMRAISRLQDELAEFKKYKDLAKYFSEDQRRLIDKVKAVHDVVKVLEPISMKFQTVLFNLLDDVNVPRT
jgi:chromosome segregation ATPase